MNKITLCLTSIRQGLSVRLPFIAIICLFGTMIMTGQSNEKLIGKWELQKVGFKKMIAANSSINDVALLNIFKVALYNQLTEEQKLNLDDLERTNLEAKMLLEQYLQTTIEFKSDGSFFNTSQDAGKSLSGEYLLAGKKLLLEWETAEKNSFKILKNSASELTLKDTKLKITYYYLKTKTQ